MIFFLPIDSNNNIFLSTKSIYSKFIDINNRQPTRNFLDSVSLTKDFYLTTNKLFSNLSYLAKNAEVALYDQMTPEGKKMYDENSKDATWRQAWLEQSLFNNYEIFKKNTWDGEGKSKNGMKMSKSLIKFFQNNSNALSMVEQEEQAAAKLLNGLNISTLDSQGKKFSFSNLNKAIMLAGKDGLNLEGTDANTAEDVTDLLSRIRQYINTDGKSMNPFTEDESGFMGGMATALDWTVTSLTPGGEYSGSDDVKAIVGKIAGKNPNQLTIDDFKLANKTIGDVLVLYGMDRETVRQGDFRPDPSKVIFEGILLLLIINYTGRIFQKNSNNLLS
jgi:hypothetical protein